MNASTFRGFSISLFLIIYSSQLFAQVFGGNPPSIKWKQINAPHSRIIFPQGQDSIAKRVSNIITFIGEDTHIKPQKKINIVLQDQTTQSNGYVALGPFRSEFYLTPPQNSFSLGSVPWADQLAVHEYRHVIQYNSFNVGLSKVMKVLFGEEGQALANAAAIPNWFFEGDAVYIETNYSQQGRGSIPSFFNDYRSLWNANKNYSWLKLRNGSLKDFVPDHYALGYLLVAYGREKYGDRFWDKVTLDAASYKGLFYPFQHAVKKYSGISYRNFRNDAFNFFKTQFHSDSVFAGELPKNEKYSDEQNPVFTEDGRVLFVNTTFKKIPQFVIKEGHELKKIRVADYTLEPYFSYRNGKMVYASYRPDTRWGYRNYSDLQIVDVATGDQKTLTHKTKYFSPGISDDGKKIVAVNVPPNGKYQLDILDAVNGEIIESMPNPDHLFYTYPQFYKEDKIISAVRNNEGKMSIASINITDHTTEYLIPFTYNVIVFPFIKNDTLYFSYSYNKNDELFAYTFPDKKLWQLNAATGKGLGKYHVAVNDNDIAWSTFTANGYRLQQFSKKDIFFKEVPVITMQKNTSSFGITSLNNINSNLLYRFMDEDVSISKYRKSFHLFNFHSLEPFIDDPQYTLTLLSENILNTLQSEVSITYDRAEKYKKLGFSATYGALFPYLSAGINYTIDRKFLRQNNAVYFNQLEPYAGFNIPLNLSKGRSFTYLNGGSQFVLNQSNFTGKYKDTFNTVSYTYLNHFISFSHQIQKAQQQIFPRFAQSLLLSLKSAVTNYSGYQMMASGNLYFPGFMKTHSIVINGAVLKKDSLKQISFSSGFPFSRGYESANFYEMKKWGINYHLPLFYPDFGFANIVYLLKVRANLFYDNTEVKDFYTNRNVYKNSFRSAGTEIYFDTKWWNQVNLNFGIRYSYLLDKTIYGTNDKNRWEIILPVNIFDN